MSRSSYIGVIRKNLEVYIIQREEYIREDGDLVFESPSRETLHFRLGEAMRENGIDKVNLANVLRKMTPKQVQYIENLKNYVNVYVTYHIFKDGTSIYAIYYRNWEMKEYVYVSDRLYRGDVGVEECISRAITRLEMRLKSKAIVYSPVKIPNKEVVLELPWEYQIQHIRIGKLCRGEISKYPLKHIIL